MNHVSDQNIFRKKLPTIFKGDSYDPREELELMMKDNFRPVSIPISIKMQREQEAHIVK